MINARSIATLGIGFNHLSISTLGFLLNQEDVQISLFDVSNIINNNKQNYFDLNLVLNTINISLNDVVLELNSFFENLYDIKCEINNSGITQFDINQIVNNNITKIIDTYHTLLQLYDNFILDLNINFIDLDIDIKNTVIDFYIEQINKIETIINETLYFINVNGVDLDIVIRDIDCDISIFEVKND